jgi:flagellar hook capping protein FlgD
MLCSGRHLALLGGALALALTSGPAGPAHGRAQPGGAAVTLPPRTVDGTTVPPVAIDFSNGRLYTTYGPSTFETQNVWQTGVTGTAPPTFEASSPLSTPVGWWLPFFRGPFSFSGARGAVVTEGVGWFGEPYTWTLLDRGAATHTITVPRPEGFSLKENHPEVSGPYTVARGRVFRADGTLVYQLPGDPNALWPSDLYGSRLIWPEVTPDGRRKIWLMDVARPTSATNPRVLDDCVCPDPSYSFGPSVSIWGDTVAWVADDNRAIVVHDLNSSSSRTVPVAEGALPTLGEGTLAWSGGWVLDLTSSKSRPVQLLDMVSTTAPELDDHLIAVLNPGDGITTGPSVKVATLPFKGKHRPRLIGVLAAEGLTGGGGPWLPQFDTTKPLTRVQLEITTSAGRTVRTLTGTGPDGSVRDLVWDGRTYGGRSLPPGTYHWQLSARAADGEGSLIGVDGGPVTGTVELS